MEFSASNIKDGVFNVDLSVTEDSFEDAIFYFSMGISRIVVQFITDYSSDVKQANALHNVLNDMCNELISDFINNGTFEEIKDASTEAELYRWMEEEFDNWLKETVGMSKDDFKKCFSNSQTLFMEPYVLDDQIIILLANGEKHIILREFSKDIVKDEKSFEKECDMAYLIAVVAGDLLFTDQENPIREKNCAGDKALMESIRILLK